MLIELSPDELNELIPLSDEELGASFDELADIAISQPDDALALESLTKLITETHESGRIDMAMRMAMELGALACLHPHMEEAATEAGKLFDDKVGHDDHDSHESHNDKHHDSKSCKTCKAGKPCRKASH